MKRGIRKKEGEELTKSKIEEVKTLLSQENPITKKEACAILNIAYNTTRLAKIIEEYDEQKEYETKRKKELKKQPLTKEDMAFIISSYLDSGNISEIVDSTFRSPQIIKRVLSKYNIPLRTAKSTYHNPLFLDDDAITEEYQKDDLVYSARYDQAALVSGSVKSSSTGKVYRIWLSKDCQYAMQPYYELSDLRRLQTEIGVNIHTRKFWEFDKDGNDPIASEINRTLANAKKRKKDE
jgi:hypothetical protein